MARYLRLLLVQLRASMLLALQYRFDFVVDALLSLFWTASAFVPLLVLFDQRPEVAGWSFSEALLVVGFFTLLKGVLDGAIHPSLQAVVEHIRKGTLDFVLLKPADAQFLVSTARFEIWKGTDAVGGLIVLGWALSKLPAPGVGDVAAMLLLLLAAVTILYSIWILVTALAFVVVKVDNLSFLFASIYDAARWPASIFRGVLSVIFTFVIPLAVMTTFPALALLGKLESAQLLSALVGALVFFVGARVVWMRSIGRYTSAGG